MKRLLTWLGGRSPHVWAADPATLDSYQQPSVDPARHRRGDMTECQGADFSGATQALAQGMVDHADRDGLKGVSRAVFMDRGGHAPGEECPTAAPYDPHRYWCGYPEGECTCPVGTKK